MHASLRAAHCLLALPRMMTYDAYKLNSNCNCSINFPRLDVTAAEYDNPIAEVGPYSLQGPANIAVSLPTWKTG
jgi:hypothetical protein